MIKFTADFMKQSLDGFGENYKYPVFASIYCQSSFFSRYNAKAGFLAVADYDKLLVVEYSNFGTSEKKYIFSAHDLKNLKIKKLKVNSVYSVKSVFKVERKTIKLDIVVAEKVQSEDFPEQPENYINFIETLKNWHINNSGGEL